MRTDRDLPVLDGRALLAEEGPETRLPDTAKRRPAPTVFGAGVTFVRAGLALIVALLTLADPTTIQTVGASPLDCTDVLAS
jgi:hypothetical protein